MKVLIGFDNSEYGAKAIEFFVKRHKPGDEAILVPLSKPDGSVGSLNNNSVKATQDVELLFGEGALSYKYADVQEKLGPGICQLARKEKTSMIIIGEETGRHLKQLLHKPTYEYVLRHSEVPVVVCRKKTKRLMKRSYGEGMVTWLDPGSNQ